MRILSADDDRIAPRILSTALVKWGFEVSTAESGADAWDRIREDRPPIVILDWMMPGIDGITLCGRIRRDPAVSRTYVILVTSRDASADRVAGLDAGANDYLSKPFDWEELRARVQVGERVATVQSELAEQIVRLEAAMARVQQLEGLLPICAYCKRIRADGNSWEQIEGYIAARSNTQFSHGVCPSCFDRVVGAAERPRD